MKDCSNESCLIKQVERQEIEAKEFGFYWESVLQLIEQIENECKEIQEAWDKKDSVNLQEEVGDLMQAAIGLAVFCKLDPCETLSKSIKKFQRRYDMVVELARNEGHESLHGHSFESMMKFWDQAKIATKN